MAQNKTKPNNASVQKYLHAIKDENRRRDCIAISRLMARVTKHKPRMWGPSIVGFGSFHYKYASGHEGDSGLTGFSSRKGAISVYLVISGRRQDKLLARLGRHKMAKSCLYLRKLSDVDVRILERLVADSVAEVKRRYPGS